MMMTSFSLSVSLQPRLLQKPHRFLRDPLLRSDPARDGGLDHAVHNRIRPDVWLRLPAGVEEEEGVGEERGREGSRVSPVGREVWTDGPPRSPPPRQPHPPPPLLLPGVHIRAMLFSGALAFFGPSLPHRSNDFGKKKKRRKKKSARTRMLLRGNTTPTPRPSLRPPPLKPPPLLLLLLLLLLLFYSIRLHYCTSTAIKPLHLVSSPEPFGRCVAARHERRGERPTDERISKVQALLFVLETWRCTNSSALKWQYRSFPPPTLYPYLWCPCWCALYAFFFFFFNFWLVRELSLFLR